jgi:hypothetical protein
VPQTDGIGAEQQGQQLLLIFLVISDNDSIVFM